MRSPQLKMRLDGKDGDKSPHVLHRDLIRPEAEHLPASQPRFEILLQVRVEAGGAVVAAVHPNAALDLNQCARRQVGEVSAPSTFRVEPELLFQRWAFGVMPEEEEAVSEL